MRTLLVLLLASVLSTTARAADPGASRAVARESQTDAWREARVRPQEARLVDLVRAGVARSATFRALVDRLEAGNVIVYVSLSPTLRSSLAGKLTWMTSAGRFRYVKATINADQSADQMIATLAHELQHALEVSADDGVTDQRSLLELYRRIGRPSTTGFSAAWETAEAEDTGFQVRRELLAAL